MVMATRNGQAGMGVTPTPTHTRLYACMPAVAATLCCTSAVLLCTAPCRCPGRQSMAIKHSDGTTHKHDTTHQQAQGA